tara:strand:+ start:241 stop:930 length:690 start_codon:yes stop_codon:yes gene_type:complete
MSTTTTKHPRSSGRISGRKRTDRTKQVLAKNKKDLERLKKKLDLRLKERDNMSKRYELLISQQTAGPRRSRGAARASVNRDYQYLTNRINSLRAEILSLEGGVITKEVLPWILGEQPKRGGFGRNFGLKSSYEVNGKTYQYKEGDMYFHDRISTNELGIINRIKDTKRSDTMYEYDSDEVKAEKILRGVEGGEISQEMEDRALSSNFYQQLQIKNNESKLNRTYTNGTF